ncbi:MAG: hypothetical protein PF692_08150 [Kiritimatiellae bacterium]|nr:hypothetical protein [Kiritimatiellia bacterium]
MLTVLNDLLASDGGGAEVIKNGRNIIYKIAIERNVHGERKSIDCAVKKFLADGFCKRIGAIKKGSKAKRTWINSLHLAQNGVGVPFPFLYADMPGGQSVFISEYLGDRISLRDKLIDVLTNNPDLELVSRILKHVADAIRLMHSSGFKHNDLGNQNILLDIGNDDEILSIEFIDLNRGFIRSKIYDAQIARDLSRLTLPGELRKIFDKYYFGGVQSLIYKVSFAFYIFCFSCHSKTRKYRHPFRQRRIEMERAGRIGYPDKIVLKSK